ncbi:MAG: FHA domain-containing protein [Eubacteriales bacterium]
MNTEVYSIVAMIGRYVLIIFCFLVFLQAILEMRKAALHKNPETSALLKWLRKRTIFPLQHENTVGKSNNCDIVVKAVTLKSRHFRIYLDCDEWIVLPINKSAVYINKFLIEEKAQVADGDKISAGRENFIFTISPESEEDEDV